MENVARCNASSVLKPRFYRRLSTILLLVEEQSIFDANLLCQCLYKIPQLAQTRRFYRPSVLNTPMRGICMPGSSVFLAWFMNIKRPGFYPRQSSCIFPAPGRPAPPGKAAAPGRPQHTCRYGIPPGSSRCRHRCRNTLGG